MCRGIGPTPPGRGFVHSLWGILSAQAVPIISNHVHVFHERAY